MKRILIITGGTGGHIFPAIALASELNKKHKTIIFGDKKTKNYVKDNYNLPFSSIISSQIGTTKLKKLAALLKIAIGTAQSLLKLILYRPNIVFAFGGYSTFPTLIACVIFRKKIIIHEQNAVLGRVNRIFAKYCYKIATTFKETKRIEDHHKHKVIHTGTSIRREILDLYKNQYQLPQEIKPLKRKTMGYKGLVLASEFDEITQYNPQRELLNILVIGGSGGAEIFSKILPKALFNLNEEFKNNIQIHQQCREDLSTQTFEIYENFNMNIEIDNFFHDMKSMINKAHLVISRSGSTSIHEFLVAKKPMILVPFAKSADNHQLENAKIFSENKAAILIEEENFTIKNISKTINDILSKDKKLLNMSQNCEEYAKHALKGTLNLAKLANE